MPSRLVSSPLRRDSKTVRMDETLYEAAGHASRRRRLPGGRQMSIGHYFEEAILKKLMAEDPDALTFVGIDAQAYLDALSRED